MKKISKNTIAMNLLLCFFFLAATGSQLARLNAFQARQDYNPPVISYPEKLPAYTPGGSEKGLLADVKAIDKEDGDVSSEVRVRSITVAEDLSGAVVTYVVRDKSNNLATARREVFVLKHNQTGNSAAGTRTDSAATVTETKTEETAAGTTAAQSAATTAAKKDTTTEKKNDTKSGQKKDKKN